MVRGVTFLKKRGVLPGMRLFDKFWKCDKSRVVARAISLLGNASRILNKIRKIIKSNTFYNKTPNGLMNPMQDFSIFNEEELTVISVYLALAKWKEHTGEKYNEKYITTLKLHKIVFEVSEQLQLPITRYWYIRGSYIPNPYIMKKSFFKTILEDPYTVHLESGKILNLIELIERYPSLAQLLKQAIDDVLIETRIIFTKEVDYLKNLYKYKPPQQYADCYKKSYEFSYFLGGISGVRENKMESLLGFGVVEDFDYYIKCKNLVTELHKSIKRINEFNPFFDILLSYTDIIESAALKIDLNKQERSKENLTNSIHFFTIQSDFYLKYIWKVFAKVIAINTVKGPRAGDVKKEISLKLHDLSYYYNGIEELSAKAEILNLVLSPEEYLKISSGKKAILEKIILAGDILERG
jgi:hypothetical protein